MKRCVIALILLVLVVSELAFAQANRDYFEILRSEAQTNKRAVITKMMQFSEKESEAFWPIYRDYETQQAKLGDKRVKLIEDFAMSYKKMSNEKAEELMDTAFVLEDGRRKLRMEYVRKFEKALSPIVAARFLQVENQMQLLRDVQIAKRLPLITESSMTKHSG